MTSDELIRAGIFSDLGEVLDALPLESLDDFAPEDEEDCHGRQDERTM